MTVVICYDSKGRVSNNGRGFIYLSGTCSVCLSVVPVCEWFRVRRLPVLRGPLSGFGPAGAEGGVILIIGMEQLAYAK